jgi:copper oxidase (laccase) domain-containing protein
MITSDLIVKNSLGQFVSLNNAGIQNFFTYDNEKWGNMSLASNPSAINSYHKLFKQLQIKGAQFIYLRPEHNNNVQIVTKENLAVYALYDTIDKTYIPITTDGIITKEKIPIMITPADCAIIAMTGLDKHDHKRFVIFLHVGFAGAVLNICKKSLELAHLYYSFSNTDIDVFIFPHISKKHYKKPKKGNKMLSIIEKKEWKGYIKSIDNTVVIDFGGKIIADLQKEKIRHIIQSGIDTYDAHKQGKLYSYVYAVKQRKDLEKRFVVGVSL